VIKGTGRVLAELLLICVTSLGNGVSQ